MAEPWNLTVNEWSDVLMDGTEPDKLSAKLKEDRLLPWSRTLIECARDCRSVLDLGCGHGEHSAAIALKGKDTTLFDWSDENLVFCKRLYGALELNGQFIQGDMTKRLPFEDRAFDFVFSCGVFEYFSDEEIVRILEEIKRVANKRAMILVPNAKAVAYRFGKWYMEKTKSWKWGGERPFKSMKPYFDRAGLKLNHEFTVGTKHSVKFLEMAGAKTLRKIVDRGFRLKDHAQKAALSQGYILISITEVNGE